MSEPLIEGDDSIANSALRAAIEKMESGSDQVFDFLDNTLSGKVELANRSLGRKYERSQTSKGMPA